MLVLFAIICYYMLLLEFEGWDPTRVLWMFFEIGMFFDIGISKTMRSNACSFNVVWHRSVFWNLDFEEYEILRHVFFECSLKSVCSLKSGFQKTWDPARFLWMFFEIGMCFAIGISKNMKSNTFSLNVLWNRYVLWNQDLKELEIRRVFFRCSLKLVCSLKSAFQRAWNPTRVLWMFFEIGMFFEFWISKGMRSYVFFGCFLKSVCSLKSGYRKTWDPTRVLWMFFEIGVFFELRISKNMRSNTF